MLFEHNPFRLVGNLVFLSASSLSLTSWPFLPQLPIFVPSFSRGFGFAFTPTLSSRPFSLLQLPLGYIYGPNGGGSPHAVCFFAAARLATVGHARACVYSVMWARVRTREKACHAGLLHFWWCYVFCGLFLPAFFPSSPLPPKDHTE